MEITNCTKADYDQIVTHIQEFWGAPTSTFTPMFFTSSNSAYIKRWEPGCGLPLWLHLTDGAYCLRPLYEREPLLPTQTSWLFSYRTEIDLLLRVMTYFHQTPKK